MQGLLQRQRRALAKSITLLESTRPDHRERADALLNALLPHTGHAMRLGISGVPGVGKSTFIEALGLALIAKGHRVAVLAVDPSSSVSGGSILGDKTRMERLSINASFFALPHPLILRSAASASSRLAVSCDHTNSTGRRSCVCPSISPAWCCATRRSNSSVCPM